MADDEARERFYAHYDACLDKVVAAHEDKLTEAIDANHLWARARAAKSAVASHSP